MRRPLPAATLLALAAAVFPAAASAADGGFPAMSDLLAPRPPEGFARSLQGDLDSRLDPRGGSAPEQPEEPQDFGRPRGATVPLNTMMTTADVKYCFLSAAAAIDDEQFRGEVTYPDMWELVAGVDVNMDINIVPAIAIFITTGFQYFVSSGEHDYGEIGTGSEGTWDFSDTFVIPVIAGIKINVPFLEPPANWFDRTRAMASGPQARLRAGAGLNFIQGGDITIVGGSKERSDPYEFWSGWNSALTFFVGIGFEYKLTDQFAIFFEFAIQYNRVPGTSSDMSAILKNPGDLDPEGFWSYPLIIGMTYGF